MASEQSDHLAEVLGAVQDRLRNPDLGLPTVRTFATLWARWPRSPRVSPTPKSTPAAAAIFPEGRVSGCGDGKISQASLECFTLHA
jgi:hypothetical protein